MATGSSCCVDQPWLLAAGGFQSKRSITHQSGLPPQLLVESTTKEDGKKHVILHHHSEDLLVCLDFLTVPNVLPEKAHLGSRSA